MSGAVIGSEAVRIGFKNHNIRQEKRPDCCNSASILLLHQNRNEEENSLETVKSKKLMEILPWQ